MIRRAIAVASGSSALDCHFVCYRMDGEFDWETVESFVGEKSVYEEAHAHTRMLLYQRAWITDLWRSDAGNVYLSMPGMITKLGPSYAENADAIEDFRLPTTFTGVWGTSDDNVFAWGQCDDECAIWHFDGREWRRTPSPHLSIYAIHGAGDVIYGVGEGGFVARWNGSAFEEIASPTHMTLSSVFVVNQSEIYAAGNGRHVIGGSIHGLRAITVAPFPIYAIARAFGVTWLAAGPEGLHRLDGTRITPVKRKIHAERLERRGDGPLLISAPNLIADTFDGLRFAAQRLRSFAYLVRA
jgi:hypothetical protein